MVFDSSKTIVLAALWARGRCNGSGGTVEASRADDLRLTAGARGAVVTLKAATSRSRQTSGGTVRTENTRTPTVEQKRFSMKILTHQQNGECKLSIPGRAEGEIGLTAVGRVLSANDPIRKHENISVKLLIEAVHTEITFMHALYFLIYTTPYPGCV